MLKICTKFEKDLLKLTTITALTIIPRELTLILFLWPVFRIHMGLFPGGSESNDP